MALTDNGNNMYMPVAPAYGGNGGFGFGGDWGWIILLLLCGWGGMGFGGMGGWGGMMGLGYDFPWLLNGQNGINNNVSGGFRDQMLQNSITSVGDKVASGFGDVQLGIAGLNNAICQTGNGISQQLYNNEIASLNRSFAEQTANTQGFNGVMAGLADAKYVEATEACATRTAAATNTHEIIDAIRGSNQAVIDKLCALELDNVKAQLAAAQRENAGLQSQVILASERADRTAQTGTIIDGIYNRLASCPVDTTPVYGRQPIFQCPVNVNGNSGCNCSGNTFFN